MYICHTMVQLIMLKQTRQTTSNIITVFLIDTCNNVYIYTKHVFQEKYAQLAVRGKQQL